jgi:hypothetical protein
MMSLRAVVSANAALHVAPGAMGSAEPRARRKRALAAALAALVAAAVPAGQAFAAPPPRAHASAGERAPEGGTKSAASTGSSKKNDSAAHRKERTGKKPARTAARAPEEARDAPARADTAKRDRNEKKKEAAEKEKKVAARSTAGKRRASKKKGVDKAAPPMPCLGAAIQIDRGGIEPERLALVDCAGKPREEARRALSVLARPWGAPRPNLPSKRATTRKHASARAAAEDVEIAPSVRLVDPGLLSRIDALAHRYPGRTVSLVSGYRPQSGGSLHQSARAVDLRIAGVRNEELVAACRALPDTGCGYYPNSSFVHVDVRTSGTGGVSWIDASGPGEPPRYVTAWPPPPDEAKVAAASEPENGPEDDDEEVLRRDQLAARVEAPHETAGASDTEARTRREATGDARAGGSDEIDASAPAPAVVEVASRRDDGGSPPAAAASRDRRGRTGAAATAPGQRRR